MRRLVVMLSLLVVISAHALPVAEAHTGSPEVAFSWGMPWEGLSTFTVLMVILYAVHLAQDRSSLGWRIVLFLLGFPLTVLASFLVAPGSQRVLGVDLPRNDRRSESIEAPDAVRTDDEGERSKRKVAWDGTVSLLIGFSLVLLFAPQTQFRSEPIGEGRYAVEQRVSWGWGSDPWLMYRRDGVETRSDDGQFDTEWSAKRWQMEPSVESLLTLLALLIVFALCMADERNRLRARRPRSSAESG